MEIVRYTYKKIHVNMDNISICCFNTFESSDSRKENSSKFLLGGAQKVGVGNTD